MKMSKSIYEETLELIENIDRNLPKTWLMGRNNLMKIKQTIEQAQKQDRLLELYKEINNKRKELITLSRHNTWSWKLDVEIKEIQDKIKELEK